MVIYVNPRRLGDRPLLMKPVVPGAYAVYIYKLPVGHIILKPLSDGGEAWFWTIIGPHIPVQLLPAKGQADTLDKAKTAFTIKFTQWHEWAEACGQRIAWNTKV